MSRFEDALRLLGGGKRSGDGWVARCPAHDDRAASLSIKPKGDDDFLARCFAGCTFEAIRDALEAKGLQKRPMAQAQEPRERRKVAKTTRHEIRDAAGELQCLHVRLDYEGGGKTFFFEMPDGTRRLTIKGTRLLYGVELIARNPGAPVVICEGEKAADALRRIGVRCALGTVGASILPDPDILDVLRDREVYLWPDNDEPGRIQGRALAARMRGRSRSLRLISWPDAPEKADAADFVEAGKTVDDFAVLADAAKAVEPELPASVVRIGNVEAVRRVLIREDARYATGRMPDAISTGIRELDRRLRGGWIPGEVYLLGAPTGSGKTTAMQGFAAIAAERGPVLYVSPEMTIEALIEREITRRCGIPEYEIAKQDDREEGADEGEKRANAAGQRSATAARLMSDALPVLIYGRSDATMADIVETARAIPGLRLIVIDYAQQVAEIESNRPRYLQVGDVANRSVDLAKELGIPVLLASQVNVTEGKRRGDERTYSFREAQILEHKASVAFILERSDPPEEWGQTRPYTVPVPAQLIIRKNRHGETWGRIEVEWWPALYRLQEPRPKPTTPQDMVDRYRERADLRDD